MASHCINIHNIQLEAAMVSTVQYNSLAAKCPLLTISLWAGVVGHDTDHSTLQFVRPPSCSHEDEDGVVDQHVESDPPSDYLTLQIVALGGC